MASPVHQLAQKASEWLKRQPVWVSLTQIVPYLKPERRRLALAAAVSVAFSTAEVTSPFLIGAIADKIVGALNAGDAAFSALVEMRWIVLALVGLAVMRSSLLVVQRALGGRIGEQVASRMRRALWQHVQDLPTEAVERRGAGRLLVRFISDTRAVQRLVSDGLLNTSHELLIAAALLVGLMLVNWRVGLAAAMVLPAYAVMFHIENPRLRQASRARRRRRTRMSAYLVERIHGLFVVKASSQEKAESKRFERLTRKLANRGAKVAAIGGRMHGYAIGATAMAKVLVLIIAAAEADANRLTVGGLITCLTLLSLLLPILRQIVIANRYLQEAHISIQRLVETLAEPNEKANDDQLSALQVSNGEVSVVGVSFSYGETPVLDYINLRARRGELVAIVGPNGSGKSTLLQMLPRLRTPTAGRIFVDSQDIARTKVSSVRAQIGFVSGDMPLFDGTLLDNVLYGAPPEADETQIQRAIHLSGADHIARTLPDGWQTRVGEGGRILSPGQRQRIALARTLVANPPIIVLDEATSALDAEAEYALANALRTLARDKTVIVAAHRLPTLRLADRIYVLHRGRVVEQGTHESLSQRQSIYAQLFKLSRADCPSTVAEQQRTE
ncbi:MAG: ABC transporter ATP-binding protein/permease [Anaerolineae bacterium]|nr:ABC transporter ATP-binding protein/permease [Anaerolineae bacterium]